MLEKASTRAHACNHCIIVINMLIFSVDAYLLFWFCSLMSVPMKGGNKTVINMGKYNIRLWGVAVLHGECDSSGRTDWLILHGVVFPTCLHFYRLHVLFVCVLYTHSDCVLHLSLGASVCFSFASFTFVSLYYQGLR